MKISLISFFVLSISLSLLSMEMKIFNVGQGNCTVVKDSHYDTLLVDAGSSSLPVDSPTQKILQNIIAYTSSEGKPVTIVVSHGDKDHYSWIPTIIQETDEKKIPVSLILGGTHTDYVPANRKQPIPHSMTYVISAMNLTVTTHKTSLRKILMIFFRHMLSSLLRLLPKED